MNPARIHLLTLPFLILTIILTLVSSTACNPTRDRAPDPTPLFDREALIPQEQPKILPENDPYPPASLSPEFADPEPLPYPVNTAGAEDSAFILPDGHTLYLWFTPNPNAPLEDQLTDGVTGIFSFQKTSDGWSTGQRIFLQDPGKLALDGCGFVQGDQMYFCSAREGTTGLHWFTAQFREGHWVDWKLSDFPESYQVGELHITANGQELYFHSDRLGGMGGYDIWVSEKVNGAWSEPVNISVINSPLTDGWPFVSADGSELWFTRGDGAPELWRSIRFDGVWEPPQRMFAPFAGEASLDLDGNVYFTHHFYKDNVALEADIYMAKRLKK